MSFKEIDKIISSGKTLSGAQVVRSNHLKLPVGVLLQFAGTSILIGVDSDDDTIVLTNISAGDEPESLEHYARLDRFVGWRLKALTLLPNKQGYRDAAVVDFLSSAGCLESIRLIAGASQIELVESGTHE